MKKSHSLSSLRKWTLFEAAADFFHFQNRDYPRAAALEWVGNRYALPKVERQLLLRGVFSQREALSRRTKRLRGAGWRNGLLVVDGHNVQITIESHLEDRILLRANDGALRDIAGQSARFRFTETSAMAIDMIFRFLRDFPPNGVLFLFDAPMSRSGEMASRYREELRKAKLAGDARAVPVPEREFPSSNHTAASSDGAVLNSCLSWIDLAGSVIEYLGSPDLTVDFSPFLYSAYPITDLLRDDDQLL
ncbi:MAG: DUF434 domain-containing protein [Syntrophobacteraceae bacterium]